MKPVPISQEVILVNKKNASGNYKYLTGIDHFRSYVKIAVSFLACLRLQMSANFDEIEKNCYKTSFQMLYDKWRASC